MVPGLQLAAPQRRGNADIGILDAVLGRGQEHVGPALEGMFGRQRGLEGAVAGAVVTAEHFITALEQHALPGVTQLSQVVVAVQVQRVVGVVLLLGVFGGVTEGAEGAVGAQAVGLAGQAAERRGVAGSDIVQAQQVAVGGQGQLGHDHVLGVDQVAVAFDVGRVGLVVEAVVVRAEDGVDVVDVGVGQGHAGQRFELSQGAVIGLLVLAPGHAADKALVVQVDALAAEHGVAVLVVVAQQGLVDLAAVGVGDHRIVALAIAGAVVGGIADAADVVRFHQAGKSVPLAALQADAGAQGLGVGIVEGVVLVDVLVAVARIDADLALVDQIGQVLGGERGCAEAQQRQGDGCECGSRHGNSSF